LKEKGTKKNFARPTFSREKKQAKRAWRETAFRFTLSFEDALKYKF